MTIQPFKWSKDHSSPETSSVLFFTEEFLLGLLGRGLFRSLSDKVLDPSFFACLKRLPTTMADR